MAWQVNEQKPKASSASAFGYTDNHFSNRRLMNHMHHQYSYGGTPKVDSGDQYRR